MTGALYAVTADGKQKWHLATPAAEPDYERDSSPAIGLHAAVYVGSRDGKVYAVGCSPGGTARAPWPMFRRDVRHTAAADTQEGRASSGRYATISRP